MFTAAFTSRFHVLRQFLQLRNPWTEKLLAGSLRVPGVLRPSFAARLISFSSLHFR
jgi:hypothetical protein